MENRKILVVDDAKTVTFTLSAILKFNKFEVIFENDSKKVIERLKAEKCILAMLDYMMPDVTGIELAEIIRKDDELKDLKLVLYTSKQLDPEEMERLRTCKMAYLRKPGMPNDILHTVNGLLNG